MLGVIGVEDRLDYRIVHFEVEGTDVRLIDQVFDNFKVVKLLLQDPHLLVLPKLGLNVGRGLVEIEAFLTQIRIRLGGVGFPK